MEGIPVRTCDDLRAMLTKLKDRSGGRPEARLGDVLLKAGLIERAQLEHALENQKREKSRHLGRILIEQGWLTPEQVNAALADKFGIPCVRLDCLEIAPEILALLPIELVLRHKVLPLAEIDGALVVAMENPFDPAVTGLLRFNSATDIVPVMAAARDIALAHVRHYSGFDGGKAVETALIAAAPENDDVDPAVPKAEREANQQPIVRLLDAIVLQGILRHASDINIRPDRKRVAVYYRIDGSLQLSRALHRSLLPALVSRVKVIGRMNIAERRLAQEGSARLAHDGRGVDLRISVIPTVNGESVVMRILDRETGIKPLSDLGLPAADEERIRGIIRQPHGLFLVTGPTGSGKSTTLAAVLNEIRKSDAHILTVEDPVEYDMDGIEQVQVADRIGFTFAAVLRRFLRHDPDVIMVGEIRDHETAAIACQAALTGHFVVSTLHTNDAPGAIARLVDMGVEPYILAATLRGVMAQRLLRLNCTRCVAPHEIAATHSMAKGKVVTASGPDVTGTFQRGRGCAVCGHTGYLGRRMVCEVLEINSAIGRLIARNAPAQELTQLAEREGMIGLSQHALQLAREGRTSLEEALAIAGAN